MWWCVRYPLVLLALTVLCQATSTSDTWVSWREPRSRMSWTQPSRTWTQPSVTWTQSSMTWTQSSRTRSTPTSGNWLQPSHELAAQFCDGMMSGSGALRDCGDYYRRNKKGKNGLLKWCIDLFTEHGMEAKCHIISKFVDKCHDNGISIDDSLWREFHSCPRPGVLITTPNMWTSGGYGDVCVDFHYLYMPADVNVYLTLNDTEVLSVSQTMDSSGCIKVPAPKDCVSNKYELLLNITSIFYQYTSAKKPTYIHCDSSRNITFIQTDKPIYKAGQKVRFRVLSVSLPKLTPIVEDIERVYMETPGGTRILQKDNVTTNLGLAELDFQLDTHPPLGIWKIFVQNSAGKHSKEFKVDEFVLPKWSVTIEAPATVFERGTAKFKVCAKYTYGEPVQGTYAINITTTRWYDRVIDFILFNGQINEDPSGCVTLTIDSTSLQGFIAWNYLVATASVTETASGITRTATSKRIRIIRYYKGIKFDEQTPIYFKPGSPIPGRVLVKTESDSSSGIEVSLELTTYANAQQLTLYSTKEYTDEDGAVQFLLPTDNAPENTTYISLRVKTSQFTAYHSFRAWYSETKHFVTIVPPYKSVPCKGCYSFRIYHNTEPGTPLRYIMLSKGFVIKSGTEYIPGTLPFSFNSMNKEKAEYFDMELEISPLLSGKATMLVYYVTQSLEFIADFIKFNVDECFQNEVTFEFDKDRGQPGEEAKYILSSASDSLCGIGVIDRSLELLAGNSFILKKQVFEILKKMGLQFTQNQFDTNKYCREKLGEIEKPKPDEEQDDKEKPKVGAAKPVEEQDEREKPKVGAAKPEPAQEAPLVAEREGGIGSRCINVPPFYWSRYVDSSIALNSIGVYAMSDLVLQTRPCEVAYPRCYPFLMRAEEVEAEAKEKEAISGEEETVDIRKFFPETFLWKLVVIPKSGSVTESVTLPDTITEWYGNAVCTNEDVGLGISDFASITTFQTFFVQLNLPYSIIRGETVHIPVLLFNYLNQEECLAVNIKMTEQPTFDIEGPKDYTICSCGQHSMSVAFTITPNIIGDIEITVVAVTVKNESICAGPVSAISASDGVSRKLLVKPEGIEISYTFGRFLCSPASLSAELPLPDQYVEGSERGQLSVIGDVMGPALSNLDGLIRMPCGCGEQTIYLTGQAAIVLKYLDVTGQATAEIKSKAIRSMSSGYQRELTFKHPNGAYSAWGANDRGSPNGSNWLTAYVIRVFALCDEYIFIDPHEQEVSMAFLESGQLKDGCFPQVGRVVDKSMQGGLISGDRPIALTAFILISLLEAGRSPYSSSVVSAIGCLDGPNPKDMSTYALALSAYAYTLYSQDTARRQEIMDELENRAIVEDGQKYWSESAGIPSNEYCPWYCRHPSYDIEMTGYVLLAMVTAGGTNVISDGLPIVKWLTSQRNAYGGWSSTQDTFVGLTALYKYSTYVSDDALDLSVAITPPGVTFHVDSSNKQVLQTSPLDVPTNISITVSGKGCALVQANVWYNIIPPLPKKPYFNIDLKVVPEDHCERQTLDMCVSYLRDDGPTNMALVQVKLVTGWEVDKDSLPQLPGSSNLTKIEFEDDMVIFYFDELTSAASCLKFQVTQEVKVVNVKPGFVTVFDYYDTNKKTSVDYTLRCD